MVYDNLRFGATAWALKFFELDDVDSFTEVAQKIQGLPFRTEEGKSEVIEVLNLLNKNKHQASLEAAPRFKEIADNLGMRIVVCGFNPQGPYLLDPSGIMRNKAIARVKRGIEYAAAVAEPGQGILSGPFHVDHGQLRAQEPEELSRLARVLKNEIVPYAEKKRVRLALEPLQPDETFIPIPGQQVYDLVNEVNSEYFAINGDTAHLFYAEGGLIKIVENLARSGNLFHFHLSEPNRDLSWGQGEMGLKYTREVLDTLSRNGYRGAVMLENFCSDLNGAVNIADPHKKTPEEALQTLRDGATYVRENSALAS